jgi:hypothetical protein
MASSHPRATAPPYTILRIKRKRIADSEHLDALGETHMLDRCWIRSHFNLLPVIEQDDRSIKRRRDKDQSPEKPEKPSKRGMFVMARRKICY